MFSLNAKKTKYILFSSRTTKTLSKESFLIIRKNQIERVTSIRLLGTGAPEVGGGRRQAMF